MLTSRFTSILAPHNKVTEEQLATEEGIVALGQNLRALNRRRFLSTLAAASAIAAAGGAFSGGAARAQAASTPPVNDVLNFALNFEFLEAEFYSYGFNGQSLAANVAASTNPASGAKVPIAATLPAITTSNAINTPLVTLAGNQLNVVQALLNDEAHHIAFLQQAIGSTAITEASIDFSAGGTMPAITTPEAYFAAARQFTALGNSAYAGAAADLVGNPDVLLAAAQILGAEAQHLGVVNYLCATLGITPAQDKPLDSMDVPPNGTAAIFTITPIPSPITQTTPPAAVGISRTPQQVLGIAYGVTTATSPLTPPTGVTKGGFFPNGVLGNITST